MDLLRSHMFSKARLVRGSDEESLVRWFPCAAGAKPFPGWHAFGSPVWEDEPRDEFTGVGVFYRDARWAPKKYHAPPGVTPCGDPDVFLYGVPASELEDTEASCADCRIRQEDPCDPCTDELEEDCTNLRVEFYRYARAAFGLRFGFTVETGFGLSFADTFGLKFGFTATTAVGSNRATVAETFGLKLGFTATTSSGHSATTAETFGLKFGFTATTAVGFGHTFTETFGLKYNFTATTSSGRNRGTFTETFGLKYNFTATTSSGAGVTIARTSLGTAASFGLPSGSITVTGITLGTNDTLIVNYGVLGNTTGVAAAWNSNTMSGPFDCPLLAGGPLTGSCGTFWYTNTGSSATGSVVVNVSSGNATFLLSLVKVTGLAANSDDFAANAANSGNPDSSTSAGTTHAAEYVQGVILLTRNMLSPSVGTWGGSFTSGGQDVSALAGLGGALLSEGYRILSATGTFDATMTGQTADAWSAGASSYY